MNVIPPLEPMKAHYGDILRECADIADERGADYGAPEINFSEIANIHNMLWSEEVDIQHIVRIFISVKFARNKHKVKRDNILDAINYLAILQSFIDQDIM